MLRRALPAILTVLALFSSPAVAQCTRLTVCRGGDQLVCRTPPRIGTNWTVCQVSLGGAGCTGYAYVFGLCFDAGIPVGPPIACASCPSCTLNVSPVLAGVFGSSCTSLPIPGDRNLVGTILCTQGACVRNTCLCLTSAVQVQIQP
jgi:hypothetical protein